MDPEQDTPGDLPENALKAGLRAVFSRRTASEDDESSVALPRVLLRDEDSEHASSPLVDASSPEARQTPSGRTNLSVLGEIARGGVGVILKGRDNDLGRDIAIKVLREEHARRPFVLHRFVEEAQIGGQLQHPGIVPVYQLGSMPDGRPFFAMKLVKGRTLAALLAERSSPQDDRARFVSTFGQVCQTMAYAHSRGVIHRDLKPANVMVGAFGEVQVVDWGLAKVLGRGGIADEERAKRIGPEEADAAEIETIRSLPGSEGTQSLAGSVMGTPAYMPPEQASGDPDRVDERSDVFALGGILCEVLTGTPPYRSGKRGALVSAATAQLADALERLERCSADGELVRIARWCLAAAREDRPRNADVVSRAIVAHQRSVEERAQQDRIAAAEARVKAVEERRARRLAVFLGSTIVVSLLAGGVTWFASMKAASRRHQHARENVGAALTEAVSHRALESWDEARTSLQYSRTLAGDGEDMADLRDRIADMEAELAREEQRAADRARLERDNRQLVARVEEVRPPEDLTPNSMAWVSVGDEYAAVFEDHGLSLERDSVEEAAERVRARGISLELASLLDSWAAARRRGGSHDRSAHLTRVALAVDDDPLRSELRRALLDADVPSLVEAARRGDLEELPGPTLNLLGVALSDAREWDEAIEVARVSCTQHPDDLGANRNLALLYRRAATPLAGEAVRYYTAALSLRPESVEVRHQLGITLGEELGRHVEAADVFRDALRRSPDDAHLLLHLGETLFALGDLPGAVAAFRECLANEPPGGTSAGQFAWRLSSADDPARRDLASAIEFAEHATDVYAYDASVWDTLAVIRYRAGDWAECIAALERSMALTRGGDAYPWFYLSASHARLGDLVEARAWFDRAVEWMEENSQGNEELYSLRAEASALLDDDPRD